MEEYLLLSKAFSNETRVKIIELLKREGALTVNEIVEKLGMEQSRISHNLSCLLHCGIVKVENRGLYRIYSLDEEVILPLLKAIEKYMDKYKNKLLSCGVLNNEEI